MAKKMLIDATHAEETRVVVVDGNKVEEFDFETINKRQLAGNIYLAKVTRVEPSLQAAFVDYGGNRHGFLAFAEIHPDYYQIPVADRQALLEEERAYAEAEEAEERARSARRSRPRSRNGARAEKAADADAVLRSEEIPGMAVIDADATDEAGVGVLDMPEIGAEEAAEPPVSAPGDDQGDDVAADISAEAREDEPYVAADHAAETDDEIESVAEEDVAEEISAPRKPRPRRYKIQEVIKVRQIMLVQVVKEERGNKGAALTTYLSLAGRYCVLMPNTARGGGISRKITNAADRKKLKEIASELEVPQGAGLIIRTAGSQRTRTEIRRDYEYLMRLWEQIRELTLKSIAPAPVYEEGDLIKRTIRDLYSKDIDEVLVEGDRGYRAAKDFMKMIMPSHAKNVKHYNEQLPLFARFQVESYLGAMFNPVVQLKSGGYIVIGVTEALVAIDVNSGRATKEGSIEETALKTNLEAADEVARQLRLRDLAGLIVIDFIDMEERRNNAAVEKRLKEKLKTDRARIQVGRISGFGLLEMSRQRLRPGMIESTTQPCPHCHGTGLIRSDDSLALQILRAIEEEGTRKRSREVLVKAPVAVANYLMNAKREHVAGIEARYGMSVRVEADPSLVSPDFAIEKFKTATRVVPEVVSQAVSVDARLMAEIDEAEEELILEADEVEEAEEVVEAQDSARDEAGEEGTRKKKRRRRRRKKGNGEAEAGRTGTEAESEEAEEEQAGAEALSAEPVIATAAEPVAAEPAPQAPETVEASAPKSRSRTRRKKAEAEPATEAEQGEAAQAEAAAPAAKKPARSRSRTKAVAQEAAPEAHPVAAETAPDAVEAPAKPKRTRSRKAAVATASAEPGQPDQTPPAEVPAEVPGVTPAEAPVAPPQESPVAPPPEAPVEAPGEAPAQTPVEMPDLPDLQVDEGDGAPGAGADTGADDKPRRRGWWSLGR
ncbi:ribonuclease E/G [Phaeovulum sp. NW3]|uniref:Rne/Rng family ribonuclease n=1 Tax=Phaeovulum sp. NW3 TaxID=2934933 RepID=UPI002021F4E0|nr:ribonuclease E/G [Phaeovulum sp. NW3]MCL7465760.1 Rne/Rng family ribonuclease [Phaeovulum sp. NW3]